MTIPENWREIWNTRSLVSNFTTRLAAKKYVTRNQPKYKQTLLIGDHPKDGVVVYYERKS